MVAALVACHWWFGSIIGATSLNGQDYPWRTINEQPYSQEGREGMVADVGFPTKGGWVAAKDYLDMVDAKEGDGGRSVSSWRTYGEVVEAGSVGLVSEGQKGLWEKNGDRHSQGMTGKGDCREEDDYGGKMSCVSRAGSREGEEPGSDEKNQDPEAVTKKAEVVQGEGRADVEVQKFFAGPPWLRHSRLESGSWMCSTYRKMNGEGRKNEEEGVMMRSESWHKG